MLINLILSKQRQKNMPFCLFILKVNVNRCRFLLKDVATN